MDYEKKYKEALAIARSYYDKDSMNAFLDTIFPELRESEDERTRKEILHYILYKADGVSEEEEHRWIAYLEKQKDASKAIETVNRIDKYIDEQVANAHDMKDSNPDKKYYQGWDDALGEIAGILQDVYSDEKQKEQRHDEDDFTIYHPLKNGKGEYECTPYSFYGSLTSFSKDKDLIDFLRTCFYTKEECNEWIEKQKEQKPLTAKEYHDKFDEMYGQYKPNLVEKKPAEWSEVDRHNLNSVISLVHDTTDGAWGSCIGDRIETWLKSLPERFNLQPKQEWSEVDDEELSRIATERAYGAYSISESNKYNNECNAKRVGYSQGYEQAIRDFGFRKIAGESIHPSWKPSEEQMDALADATIRDTFPNVNKVLLESLYEQLKRL